MTKEELIIELEEKIEDLKAFTKARDLLFSRIQYIKDHSGSAMPLHEWAGTHAIMNTFEVILHNMERLVDELKEMEPELIKTSIIDQVGVQTLKTSHLRLVKNGEEQT